MHDLSLYLLDIIENSLRAGAGRVRVALAADRGCDRLTIAVEDDGPGLPVPAAKALDPFFTTKHHKKTGLGLSLFRQAAEDAGGGLEVGASSALGGVAVSAHLRLGDIDRPPLGDVAGTVLTMVATNPHVDFAVELRDGDERLAMRGSELPRRYAELVAFQEALERHTPRHAEQRDRTKERPMSEDVKPCTCCAEEPTEEELLARLDAVIADYRGKPGALIPVLQLAQGIFGYLPESALKHIARELRKPYSEVAGVVGFYSFFTTVPRGRHLIRVCLGTACYVRGGVQVLDAFKKDLGIDIGGTTEDRRFSLEVARCFGACGLAPVITVDDDVHHRVKPKRIREILAQYAEEPLAAETAGRSARRSAERLAEPVASGVRSV